MGVIKSAELENDELVLRVKTSELVDISNVDRSYRMYCLVLRQLSPIQKGVQSAHSIVEYADKYCNTVEYETWSRVNKTIIMLDGGVVGELNDIIQQLEEHDVKYAIFEEEDLDNIVTSISILVDEKVFDGIKYPDFDVWRNRKYPNRGVFLTNNIVSDMILGKSFDPTYDPMYDKHHNEWLNEVIGGEKNEFLRNLLKYKRLAQ